MIVQWLNPKSETVYLSSYGDLVDAKYFYGELLGDESVLPDWEAPFIAYTHGGSHGGITSGSMREVHRNNVSLVISPFISVHTTNSILLKSIIPMKHKYEICC